MSLTVTYDEPSDSLHIDTCLPYSEQESDIIEPGIVARFNPSSGRVENIEILSFRARIAAGKTVELPPDLQLISVSR